MQKEAVVRFVFRSHRVSARTAACFEAERHEKDAFASTGTDAVGGPAPKRTDEWPATGPVFRRSRRWRCGMPEGTRVSNAAEPGESSA